MYTDLWFDKEPVLYSSLLITSLIVALVVFIVLFFISAGYGRYSNEHKDISINSHLGWFVMEIPTVIVMITCFVMAKDRSITHFVFLGIWLAHYAHRAFIYPFRISKSKKMTLLVVVLGFIFNLVNTYIQGRWLFTFSNPAFRDTLPFTISNADYSSYLWLLKPQFIIGFIIFVFGYFINKQSDFILRNLRKSGDTNQSYKIPIGGLYKRLSCPNYLGEILEWVGWAVLTWSLAGVYFTFWTIANLLPRAISHHKWYKETFDDYPEDRKAIIPFLL